MISALAAATLLSATLLMVVHAARPTPKRVPVRVRDQSTMRRPRD